MHKILDWFCLIRYKLAIKILGKNTRIYAQKLKSTKHNHPRYMLQIVDSVFGRTILRTTLVMYSTRFMELEDYLPFSKP